MLYSLSSGEFTITCLLDGWTTAARKDLRAAVLEWNLHQIQASERIHKRQLCTH